MLSALAFVLLSIHKTSNESTSHLRNGYSILISLLSISSPDVMKGDICKTISEGNSHH